MWKPDHDGNKRGRQRLRVEMDLGGQEKTQNGGRKKMLIGRILYVTKEMNGENGFCGETMRWF